MMPYRELAAGAPKKGRFGLKARIVKGGVE